MRIRVVAWSAACIFLIAACTPSTPTSGASGARSGTPSSKPAAAVIHYSAAALGAPIWTNATCGPLATNASPTRVPLPAYGSYVDLAVDGNGAVWFAGHSSVACYGAGQAFHEFPLGQGSQAVAFKTGPDGSVWFADGGLHSLGRIGTDGVLTEHQLETTGFWPRELALGPDGSVWFDSMSATRGTIVSRLRPDGGVTDYPIEPGSLAVDSHGSAWMTVPGNRTIARVSDAGVVSEFKFDGFIDQFAEGLDGRMWFLNGSCMPGQRLGWIDVGGQTHLLDAPLADGSDLPSMIARAADGAIWFGTVDGRLVRMATETDVTVYNLPWPDANLGRFFVLPGNHILMESWTAGLGHLEMLDFTATGGTRVAGVNAIPQPSPHYAVDAAEGVGYSAAMAAYSAAAPASSKNAKALLIRFWEGDHAALFEYNINRNRCDPLFMYAYLFDDSAGWHQYDVIPGSGSYLVPEPKGVLFLKFQSGCVNVHQSPGLGSRVLSCVPSSTSVNIDQLPVYADGEIWWHIVSRAAVPAPLGWAVQKYLVCSDYFIGRLPQC